MLKLLRLSHHFICQQEGCKNMSLEPNPLVPDKENNCVGEPVMNH